MKTGIAVLLVSLLLCGCTEKEPEVVLDSTQVVTTKETVTVRETSREWMEKMEKANDSIYVPIK